VPVALDGILRVEHTPRADGSARLRVVFVGRPEDDSPPLSAPNEHALEAAWVSLEDMTQMPMRGPDVIAYCSAVADGAPVLPLHLLASERDPLGCRKTPERPADLVERVSGTRSSQ
jgi:hypothetical protein